MASLLEDIRAVANKPTTRPIQTTGKPTVGSITALQNDLLSRTDQTSQGNQQATLTGGGLLDEIRAAAPKRTQTATPGQVIAGMRITAGYSEKPIHYGTHKGGHVYDFTEREAVAKYGSMEAAAKALEAKGYVVRVRRVGQSGIESNHIHAADPKLNPQEAARLRGQSNAPPSKQVPGKPAPMTGKSSRGILWEPDTGYETAGPRLMGPPGTKPLAVSAAPPKGPPGAPSVTPAKPAKETPADWYKQWQATTETEIPKPRPQAMTSGGIAYQAPGRQPTPDQTYPGAVVEGLAEGLGNVGRSMVRAGVGLTAGALGIVGGEVSHVLDELTGQDTTIAKEQWAETIGERWGPNVGELAHIIVPRSEQELLDSIIPMAESVWTGLTTPGAQVKEGDISPFLISLFIVGGLAHQGISTVAKMRGKAVEAGVPVEVVNKAASEAIKEVKAKPTKRTRIVPPEPVAKPTPVAPLAEAPGVIPAAAKAQRAAARPPAPVAEPVAPPKPAVRPVEPPVTAETAGVISFKDFLESRAKDAERYIELDAAHADNIRRNVARMRKGEDVEGLRKMWLADVMRGIGKESAVPPGIMADFLTDAPTVLREYRKIVGQMLDEGISVPPEVLARAGLPAPKPPTAAEVKLSALDAREQVIRDRMAARAAQTAETAPEAFKGKPKQRGATLSPDDLADYAELGKVKFEKGAVKFADWSKQMIEEAKRLGHDIETHLAKLWADLTGEGKAKVAAKALDSGISKRETAVIEAEYNIKPTPVPEFRTKDPLYSKAKKSVDAGKMEMDAVERRIRDTEYSPTPEEMAGIDYHRDQLTAAIETATPKEAVVLTQKLQGNIDASHLARRRWSESGHVLQSSAKTEEITLSDALVQAQETKGRKLTVPEVENITDLQKRIAKTEADLKIARAKVEEQAGLAERYRLAQRTKPIYTTADFLKNEWGASNTKTTRKMVEASRARGAEIKAQRASFIEGIKGKRGSAPLEPFNAEMVDILKTEIKFQIESGMRFSYESLARMLREVYGATAREIAKAWEIRDAARNAAAIARGETTKGKLKSAIAEGEAPIKQPPLEPSTELTAIRAEIAELRKQLPGAEPAYNARLRRQIIDLERGLKREPKEVERWDRETVRLRTELEALRSERVDTIGPKEQMNAGTAIKFALKGTLGWVTGGENSFMLRQGWNALFDHPTSWWKPNPGWVSALKKSMKAMISEGDALLINDHIRMNEHFPAAQQSRIFYSPLEQAFRGPLEEAAGYMRMVRRAEELPGVLGKVAEPFGKFSRMFERAYSTAGNVMRHEPFYQQAEMWKVSGAEWPMQAQKNFADMMNKTRGRGHLGKWEPTADDINLFIISVRKVAADIQTPLLMASKDPYVRGRAGRMHVKQAAALVSTALVVNHYLGGSAIGLDPGDTTRFMRFRWKNTRFDLIPGGQRRVIMDAWAVGRALLYQGSWAKDWEDRPNFYKDTATEIATSHGTKGINPGLRWGMEQWTGEDFRGAPISRLQSTANLFTQWYYQDVMDAWRYSGPEVAAVGSVLGFLGVGMQSYEDSPAKAFELNKPVQDILKKYKVEVGRVNNSFTKDDETKQLSYDQDTAFQKETYHAIALAVKEFEATIGKEPTAKRSDKGKLYILNYRLGLARQGVRDKYKALLFPKKNKPAPAK